MTGRAVLLVDRTTLPVWDAVEQRRLARRARRHRHRCRECRRRITDALSLRLGLGSGCRRKLGITGRRLQISRTIRVRDPGHVTGQLVLPDDLTPWITG
ncbi:hypothetical protein [Sphaerisporangium sp. NPDC051011]|uniref:hypothetical protein n=1 Tax=Sphaerisporangium sp. NPDC051011 TaxID=3155792 RepID=UPI0033D8FF4D